jgi:hypothetical protein
MNLKYFNFVFWIMYFILILVSLLIIDTYLEVSGNLNLFLKFISIGVVSLLMFYFRYRLTNK